MSKKLEQLLVREKQIKAQIQQIQARERTKERKKETRRKILIGAAILAQVRSGEFSEKKLSNMMNEFLKRSYERELFGLPEVTSSLQAKQPKRAKSSAKKKAQTPQK